MEALAAEHGFPLTRIEAIDAQQPDQLGPRPTEPGAILGAPILPGDLACSLSHRLAWQMIVDQGHKAAVLLEDDCVLADSFAQFLDTAWIPPGAKVVRLETVMLSARYGPLQPLDIPGRKIARMRSRHTGTAAAVITRAGAELLLERLPQFHDPVDQMMYNERSPIFADLAPLQVFPAPAIQGAVLSRGNPTGWAESSIDYARDAAPPVRDAPTGPIVDTWRKTRRGARKYVQRAFGVEKLLVPFG